MCKYGKHHLLHQISASLVFKPASTASLKSTFSVSFWGRWSPRLRLIFGGSTKAPESPSSSSLTFSRSASNLSNSPMSIVFAFFATRPLTKGCPQPFEHCRLLTFNRFFRLHRRLNVLNRLSSLSRRSDGKKNPNCQKWLHKIGFDNQSCYNTQFFLHTIQRIPAIRSHRKEPPTVR